MLKRIAGWFVGAPPQKATAIPARLQPTAGEVRGRHFHSYVDEVKQLMRDGHDEAAMTLLYELVDATEAEAQETELGVAPWYYERLAVLYRRNDRLDDEVAILERYAARPKALGAMPAQLAERLLRARELANRSRAADQNGP